MTTDHAQQAPTETRADGPRWAPPTYRAALREPAFARLLPGFALSSLGTGMSAIAIAWQALEIASPEWRGVLVGASLAAYELPAVIGGLGLSRWLGRRRGSTLLAANCLSRAVFLGAASILALVGWLHPIAYLLLLAASSVLVAWGRAGQTALIAELLPPDARLSANALLGGVGWGTMVIGPGLAGVLSAVWGPGLPIGLDAASYLVLALSLLTVRHLSTDTDRDQVGAVGSPLSALSGLQGLLRVPMMGWLLTLTIVVGLVYGPFEVALPVFVNTWPHGGATALGAMWSAFGIGAIIGSTGAGLLRERPIWPVGVGVAAIWGCCLFTVGLSTSLLIASAGLFVAGMVYAPYPALNITYLQNNIPPEELAGAAAAWGSLMTLAGPLGFLLGGPLVIGLGAQGTLLGVGAATVILTLSIAAARAVTLRRR